jgi:hypothetical protein
MLSIICHRVNLVFGISLFASVQGETEGSRGRRKFPCLHSLTANVTYKERLLESKVYFECNVNIHVIKLQCITQQT